MGPCLLQALEGFQIVDASRQALLGSIAKKQLREPSLVDLKWSEGSRDILATLASSGSFCIWDVRQRSMPGKTQMVHPTTLAGAANRLAWAPFEKESKLAVSKGKYVRRHPVTASCMQERDSLSFAFPLLRYYRWSCGI